MKRQFVLLFTTAALCTALTASAFASAAPAAAERDKLISQLGQQAHRLDWDAQGTKGIPRAQLEQQSLRVKKLIQRLQAGEAVDPQEIDNLLKEQPWPR